MKNIFVALALFFALGASAQAKKAAVKPAPTTQEATTPDAAAQKDLTALSAVVTIKDNVKPEVLKLLVTKHRDLQSNGAALSDDRKMHLANYVAGRLELLLGAADFAKVKANTALFAQLTK